MRKLENKVAFITGASRGIGEGIAKTFAKHGAKLILAARSESTGDLAKQLCESGTEAIWVPVDVTNPQSIKNGAEKAVEKFGRIDILVSNAGVCRLGEFLEPGDENRDFHIDVNIKGTWNAAKLIIPYMIRQKYGKIVIMSSVTGDMVADPGEAAYAMTKAALIGLTKALAREFAGYNINVNAICPGYVLTPMVKGMARQSCPQNPKSVIDGIAGAIPLKRLAAPEEIGELAAFLGSDEASYLTGAQFVIDGGSTLPETMTMGV